MNDTHKLARQFIEVMCILMIVIAVCGIGGVFLLAFKLGML